jgi:hypothetical protein
MAATTTMQRVEQQLDQIHKTQDPQQTRAKIVALPATMTYEARYALQQVKEQAQQQPQLLELVEPLARAIGWAEALVFAFDTTKEREILNNINNNS